jgi:GrpB-like predicted nucleotidyltransferase (UPF0157 family)
MRLSDMSRVELKAYDPEWPRTFERIRARVWPAVQHAAMSLEHVGSTSVPGLRAKPVIDACIVVASRRDIPHVVKALATIGFVHRGDLGVPYREAFKPPPALPKHHLYASHRGSLSLKNHLGLRDYLRAHPNAAREYGDLKEALARRFPEDIDSYIAGKTEFILGILRQIGITDEELATIRRLNRMENLARPTSQ